MPAQRISTGDHRRTALRLLLVPPPSLEFPRLLVLPLHWPGPVQATASSRNLAHSIARLADPCPPARRNFHPANGSSFSSLRFLRGGRQLGSDSIYRRCGLLHSLSAHLARHGQLGPIAVLRSWPFIRALSVMVHHKFLPHVIMATGPHHLHFPSSQKSPE